MNNRGGSFEGATLAGGPADAQSGGLLDGAGPAGGSRKALWKTRRDMRGAFPGFPQPLPRPPWKSLRPEGHSLSHSPLENSRPAYGQPGVSHTAHSPYDYGYPLKDKENTPLRAPPTGSGPLSGTRTGTRWCQKKGERR